MEVEQNLLQYHTFWVVEIKPPLNTNLPENKAVVNEERARYQGDTR